MTAFTECVKRGLSLPKGSKSNIKPCETAHIRFRIETIASTIKKASNLQQDCSLSEKISGKTGTKVASMEQSWKEASLVFSFKLFAVD